MKRMTAIIAVVVLSGLLVPTIRADAEPGALVTAIETGAPVGCVAPGALPYRGDILPYLQASSDTTVPAGRYSLGDPSDAGRTHEINEDRDSWVTVRAESPGSVVVDGAINQGGLRFAGNGSGRAKRSQKLVVAGIHFVATSVMYESTQDISLWYTCHEYTPQQFHENAMAAAATAGITIPPTGPKDPHGDGGGIYSFDPKGPEWEQISSNMGAYLPTGIRGNATSDGASRHLRFFGVDVGPVADDGIYMGSTWNVVIQGTRIHNISELYPQPNGDAISVDPGPVHGNEADQFHNDGIQIGRAGYKPLVLDTWAANRLIFNKPPTTVRSGWDLIVRRSWFGSTPTVNTQGADQVANLTHDPKFADWLLGNQGGPWSSEAILLIAAGPRGNTAEQMSAELTDITFIAHTGSQIHYELTGVTRPGPTDYPNLTLNNIKQTTLGLGHRDIFTNTNHIAQHPQNPANIWRTQHPYNQHNTYPGLTTPTYTDPGVPGDSDDVSIGDVNCNGGIELADALMIAQHSVNSRIDSGGCPLANPSRELNLRAADANNDGQVTLADALLIARCTVGLSNVACSGR